MVLIDKLRRPSALAASAILLVASLVPLLSQQKVGAYGLLQDRKITMSSSADGTLAAGQDVTYEAVFEVTTDTSNIGGIVIDFCGDSPIIGDDCTAPTGFDLDEANLAFTVSGSTLGAISMTLDATATTANTLVLNHATDVNPAVGEVITVTLGTGAANDGVDNPDGANSTFYARILTYTTAAGADAYVDTAPGSEPPLVDAGGIALSTAAQITVTAKVQERLVFCVYTGGAGYANNDCTGKSGTSVLLGDTNGVLDPSGPYVDITARYSVTTNASGNAIIRAKGGTLTSGAFTIDAASGTPEVSSTGAEQYGFCSYQQAGSGMTIDAVYDGVGTTDDCTDLTQSAGTGTPGGLGGASDTQFAFDTASLSSTYGDEVATKPAGSFSTGVLGFIGNISNTTEAGIYTSTMTFIATGTY
jgi:hypothetical protein